MAIDEQRGPEADKPAEPETSAAAGRDIREAEWIAAAREILIEQGVGAIKIDRLARRLKVTRGGFYWRFEYLANLLAALLDDCRNTNSVAILAALEGAGTPAERFDALMRVWIEEDGYSSAYDTAVRAWGRVDPDVSKAVHEVDDLRLAAFERLFADAGCSPREALVRARVSYYHQVGYYAMGVEEPRRRRWELSATYRTILTGWD
jgi:AcrR family transcriptional regulator